MLKILLAASLALAPCPLAPAIPIPVEPAAIPKIVCAVYAGPILIGFSMGSAFRIGHNLLVSARHVTHEDHCAIDGKPITEIYTKGDFSLATYDAPGPNLPIDCGGFVKGRRYLAEGHARGLDQITTVELEGTGVMDGQFAILVGIETVIPGQSGGVLLDAQTGKAVGTVNNYEPQSGRSGSIALKDTPICEGRA